MSGRYDFLPHGVTIGVLGQGYVGSILTRALQQHAQSHKLHVVPLTRYNWQEAAQAITFDYIINAAGYSGDFRSNPMETIESNINFTTHVLRALRIRQSYLAISSTRVYGFSEHLEPPACESSTLPPLRSDAIDTIYDGSKVLLESLVLQACPKLDIKPVVARLSNIYGRSELDDKTLIKKLIRLAREGNPCPIGQHPLSSKDYIHADDAATGMLRALFLSPQGGIYNVGSGVASSLQDIAEILSLNLIPSTETSGPFHRSIDISKARTELDFIPEVSIRAGLMAELE